MKQARDAHGWFRWSSALLLIVVTAGCGETPFDLTLSSMEGQRGRWLRSGIVDYRYEHVRSCECLPATTRPAVVEVRDGVVASVVYTESGEPADATVKTFFPTIDELFAIIDDAIERRAASLIVSYHPALGYPTSISIDYDPEVADDEFTIDATNLEPL